MATNRRPLKNVVGDTLPIAIPACVAILGFGATYRNSLQLAKRKDKLDRLDRQLGQLYGPLLAGVSAGNRSWDEVRDQYRPHGAYWDQDPPPTEEEAESLEFVDHGGFHAPQPADAGTLS